MKASHPLITILLFLTGMHSSAAAPRYTLSPQWSSASFSQPLDLQFASVKGEEHAFVVEQNGRIILTPKSSDGARTTTILDISERVTAGGEQGLLGLALHPRFSQNGFLFVNYTRLSDGATVIARYTVDLSTLIGNPASEQVFLVVPQPFSNHNGGSLAFGADGFLYIPLGDGGSAGDPLGNAQSLDSLLGKILRIDVDTPGQGAPYSIPPSNPFTKRGNGARPEIFALGLRNPFKITRDAGGRRIWIGDVGQNMREEIDILRRGANYGWNFMEGDLCYPEPTRCIKRRFQKPVWTIPRSQGRSVTGGYVYRGEIFKRLRGSYIYGDFVTGKIWRLSKRGRRYTNRVLLSSDRNISSFGQDASGEIYVVDYSGSILKLLPLS